jgi:type I restriction enzyme, S subunit
MKLRDGFNLLVAAPGGIARLRELIRSLALQGKLVPRNPGDEPTVELLKRIRDAKQRSIANSKVGRKEPLDEIADGEKLAEPPEGWETIRFGDVWDHSFYGPRFSSDDYVSAGGLPTVRTTDMSGGRIVLNNAPRVKVPVDKRDTYLLKRGDLLVTRSGSIGVMALFDLDLEAIPSAYLIRIRLVEQVSREYCLLFLNSPDGQKQMGLSTTSVGVPNVNATKMASFIMPLPPLAEQLRIVAKVDELMGLCDELETRGQLEAERHAQLISILLDALAASESAHALAENWSRIAENFDLLLDRPEAVDALEQTVMQLAVRGRLVAQDPNDDPAGELLEKISAEKDQAGKVTAGDLRK